VQRDILNWDLPVRRLEVTFEWNPVYEAVGLLLSIPDIAFDMPAVKLVIDAADLERALPQANSVLCRQHARICDEIVQRRHKRAGLSGRVRELLVRRGGLTDQDNIAAELNISARSLRRRLAEEGTSFRELTLETTGTLAEELLRSGCTVDAVAHRLGYASISAFSAAFRTWSGRTPGQFARDQQYSARNSS
jgi:AraC-like DNA-binding protein